VTGELKVVHISTLSWGANISLALVPLYAVHAVRAVRAVHAVHAVGLICLSAESSPWKRAFITRLLIPQGRILYRQSYLHLERKLGIKEKTGFVLLSRAAYCISFSAPLYYPRYT
jgi:hypothetical protein